MRRTNGYTEPLTEGDELLAREPIRVKLGLTWQRNMSGTASRDHPLVLARFLP